MKRLLVIVLPLLLIVGCSQKPVEDSTLINKDGLMYLPDSDKPYTGEVFTNYSTGEKLYQGTYEDGLLLNYSYLNKDGSVKEPINYETTLVERDDFYYTKDTNKPYSGQVFSLYDDGKKKEEGTYKNGKPDGLWKEWYENGQKKYEGSFKDGFRNGFWSYWNEEGEKTSEINYKNGKKNGLRFYWWEYDNDKIMTEEIYKDGEIISDKEWYYNGNKEFEKSYKDGKPDGLWKEWYENGQKKYEGSFKDGFRNGFWTYWYENGQKEIEFSYKKIKPNGIWTYWDRNDGKRYSGKPVGLKDINEDWIPLNESYLIFKSDFSGYVFHHTSFKDKKVNGVSTYWFENGQKSQEITYKDGEKDGLETGWFENGKLKYKGNNISGKPEGNITYYYDTGQKMSEGTYSNGNLISEKCWDKLNNECECSKRGWYYGCK